MIKLESLWDSLGNETIDEDECIEREWHIFPKGTHREDIWHWFEDQDKNFSVANHLYGVGHDYGAINNL